MKRSEGRILTTHAGSLPRPADLLKLIQAKERGEPYDRDAYIRRVRTAVATIVGKQVQLGLDVIDDGEMGKAGFIPYVNERLAGFEVDRERSGSPFAGSREFKAFPEFYEWFGRALPSPAASLPHMVCTGPISYKGHAQVQADIDNLKAALEGANVAGSLPSRHFARRHRGVAEEPLLQDRRGIPVRDRRRHARGIQAPSSTLACCCRSTIPASRPTTRSVPTRA